jgi:hypothetical protein
MRLAFLAKTSISGGLYKQRFTQLAACTEVDSVPGFLSSRPKWDTPLTRRRVCPPLWFRGEGIPPHAGKGAGGVPIWTRGQTLLYSMYFVAACQLRTSFQLAFFKLGFLYSWAFFKLFLLFSWAFFLVRSSFNSSFL